MPHYHDNTPLDNIFTISAQVRGTSLELLSANAIFSKTKLDRGTELLLESCTLPENGRVLDLGCGIGVVGLFVKKWLPNVEVVQSDVTQKAVQLATKNSKKLKLKTQIVLSNVYDSLHDELFNTILVNPPRAAGKNIIALMISQAPEHLTAGGSLQLVAAGNKGGASYQAMMQEAFGNVEIIGRGSGFKVYRSVKN